MQFVAEIEKQGKGGQSVYGFPDFSCEGKSDSMKNNIGQGGLTAAWAKCGSALLHVGPAVTDTDE